MRGLYVAETILRCSKCFITLSRLKADKITDFLVKIAKEDKSESYLCTTCLNGW